MTKDAFAAARALVLPTVALLGLVVFAPGRLEVGVRIYALVVSTAVIVVLLLALRRAYPDETPLSESTTRAARRLPPPSLERVELETALAVAGSFDLHYRLVPRLRSVSAGLLSARRQVSLAEHPETARALLGEEVWELVRPDRPAPEDRLAQGIAPDELGHVVNALEAV